MKILFVCTGNTCRSPMAEAILKDRMPEAEVQSAGIFAGGNQQANPNTINVLEQHGIEINHQSQPVTDRLLDWADVVLTMTTGHKQSLIIDFADFQEKFYTLKEFISGADKRVWQELNLNNYDIQDPFGGNLATYEETFKEMDAYIGLLIKKIDR